MERADQGIDLVPPGKGEKLWVADELMTFHHREDESFYMLEGEFEFLVGTTGSRPPQLLRRRSQRVPAHAQEYSRGDRQTLDARRPGGTR